MLEFALDNPEIPIGIVTDQHLKRRNFLSMLFLLMVSKWPRFTLLHSTRPMVFKNLKEVADIVCILT